MKDTLIKNGFVKVNDTLYAKDTRNIARLNKEGSTVFLTLFDLKQRAFIKSEPINDILILDKVLLTHC